MDEDEKQIVMNIYHETNKYAYSSHICRDIFRMYPDAFFKPSHVDFLRELHQQRRNPMETFR